MSPDLESETEVEALGVEDLPTTPRKPRLRSVSSSPLPSNFVAGLEVQDSVSFGTTATIQPSPDAVRVNILSAGSGYAQATPPRGPAVDTVEIFRVLAMVLSARALVLAFGSGAFVIALIAALRESREVLWVFVAWCLLTVIPAVVLEMRRKDD